MRCLEQRIGDMNEQVVAKAKDINAAREAQISLQTEISTYKNLLEQDPAQGYVTINCSFFTS